MRHEPILRLMPLPVGMGLAAGPLGAQAPAKPKAAVVTDSAAAADRASGGRATVSAYAQVLVVSCYIWRPYDLSMNQPAVQPYAELHLPARFVVLGFTSVALDHTTELDEVQLGITWSHHLAGAFDFALGYQLFLLPGTQTEPGTDPHDPLRFTTTGEFTMSVTGTWSGGFAELTYARGYGTSDGNSVNLWLQQTIGLGGLQRLQMEPFFQFGYLDQYGPPPALAEKLSGIEIGVPVYWRVGGLSLEVSGQLDWVPSNYIRTSNGASPGGSSDALLPWASVGIVWGR
jgi:hypothetical protein